MTFMGKEAKERVDIYMSGYVCIDTLYIYIYIYIYIKLIHFVVQHKYNIVNQLYSNKIK